MSDLQVFSSNLIVMTVLNSMPTEQWPNQRMLENSFCDLRTVRRLERVIDKIKNSIENPMRGEFDYLSDKLQEFLVQCRNVRI